MENKSNFVTLPGAIIIAGAIIAMAIIWTKKPTTSPVANTNQNAPAQVNLAPITNQDHILGNPNAPIKIVEYSDPSCPFCKAFHPTMVQLMKQYGPEGKVAWVYRHFPLDKPNSQGQILHPNAGKESQAFECAAALGGNDAFWAYTNRLYEVTPSVTGDTPNGLDPKQLPEIAKYAKLDPVAFNECLTSGRFKDRVEKDYTSGINAGVTGTPYTIIITPTGEKIPLVGLVSLATLKSAVDTLLTQVK
jgi:protein-disulfide isomerase